MRKAKIGAVQWKQLPMENSCRPFGPDYDNSIENIMEKHVKPQLAVTLNLLAEAGKTGLDIVTTGEDCCVISAYFLDVTENNIFPALAEAAAAYAEEQIAAVARQYNMYIVACYFKRYPDGVYNVASLFDRTGTIVGEYRKSHLPSNELWQVKAGDTLDVFQTDFGTIGILICYDIMYPEPARILSLKKAEVVFHPTAGYGWYDSIGEATLRTRANDGSMYIVTSKNYNYMHAGHSSVIDYWGQVLADAGFYENRVVWQEIDLDVPKTQPDWFNATAMSGEANLARRTFIERRPDMYGLLADETLAERLTAPSYARQLELIKKSVSGEIHWG